MFKSRQEVKEMGFKSQLIYGAKLTVLVIVVIKLLKIVFK